MKAILVIELLNGNFFLETQGIEITKDEFQCLKELSPGQMWIILKPVRPEEVPNSSFDWDAYNKYQEEFETSLKNRAAGNSDKTEIENLKSNEYGHS